MYYTNYKIEEREREEIRFPSSIFFLASRNKNEIKNEVINRIKWWNRLEFRFLFVCI